MLLKTVLTDLKNNGAKTRMALEIKSVEAAKPLCKLLFSNPDLIPTIGWVMSFKFVVLDEFV